MVKSCNCPQIGSSATVEFYELMDKVAKWVAFRKFTGVLWLQKLMMEGFDCSTG